ncbi:hypothetical protein OKW34_002758 [Paraburkholderia youngii]
MRIHAQAASSAHSMRLSGLSRHARRTRAVRPALARAVIRLERAESIRMRLIATILRNLPRLPDGRRVGCYLSNVICTTFTMTSATAISR